MFQLLNTDNRLCDAIYKRTSVRSFSPTAIDKGICSKLFALAESLSEMSTNIRIVFVNSPGRGIFKGLIGSYGVIKNAPAYAAFIGSKDIDHVGYEMGYYGEQFILAAVAEGLGTCWISGSFKPDAVASEITLKENERVFAVTPIGYTAQKESASHKLLKRMVGSAKRKPLEQICNINLDFQKEGWVKAAAEAMQTAPSARNAQPWYAEFGQG